MTLFASKEITPEVLSEANRLMNLGYGPAYAAWIVDVQPLALAKAVMGYGGHRGLRDLAKAVRETRVARVKANIEAYPNTSLFSTLEAAA